MSGTDLVTRVANQIIYDARDPDVTVRDLIAAAIVAGIELAGGGRRPTIGGLTKLQRDLLMFLLAYTEDHGHAPSYDEMKAALGLRSKSGVHRLVRALEERGAIKRIPDRARAIEVIAVPVQVSQ